MTGIIFNEVHIIILMRILTINKIASDPLERGFILISFASFKDRSKKDQIKL